MSALAEPALRLDRAGVSVGGTPLLHEVSMGLAAGEMVALVGPNGAGKTTLLRVALGLLAPREGRATIDGHTAHRMTPVQRARLVSYLPQLRTMAWPVRVADAVALGRYAYGAAPGRLRAADVEAVERALADCDLLALADRRTDTLSGGERARVHCARALAAQTPLLLADEPVANLDPRHEFEVMTLLRGYVRNGGGALIVLHDLSLAARFADRLVWLKAGRVVADGTPAETLTAESLRDVFRIDATVEQSAAGPAVRVAGTVAP